MVKKKRINKEQLFLLTSSAVCFAFMAFTTMLFPVARLSAGDFIIDISGLHAVYGGKVTLEYLGSYEYKFNIVLFIGYLLPIISLVLSVLAFKKEGRTFNFIAAILCFIAALIMFSELLLFQVFNSHFINDFFTVAINPNIAISFGPILGGVLALISGLLNLGCFKLKS